MMHPHAFWSAITQNPHDDEPRLAYAHWLDERDNPLGEFIRLQCQLEKLPLANPLRAELESRERELLADHEVEWLGPLEPVVDWCVFRRGLPDEIAISTSAFLRHGENLLAHAPIQQVHLSAARDKMNALASFPALAQVSFLDLSNNHLRFQSVRPLAQSRFVSRLEGLNLSSTGIGDDGVRALAESVTLVGLRELYLCDNRITRAGVRALADSPLVQRLEVLSLRFNDGLGQEPAIADLSLSVHI